MANTVNFSLYYKQRVVKAIVANTRTLNAFVTRSKGSTFTSVNDAHIGTTALASTLGNTISGVPIAGAIPFAGLPVIQSGVVIQISNSAASAQLTIPAGTIVHAVGLANGSTTGAVLYAYVMLSTPDDSYYYEEQGTLTIPSGGYTIRHT